MSIWSQGLHISLPHRVRCPAGLIIDVLLRRELCIPKFPGCCGSDAGKSRASSWEYIRTIVEMWDVDFFFKISSAGKTFLCNEIWNQLWWVPEARRCVCPSRGLRGSWRLFAVSHVCPVMYVASLLIDKRGDFVTFDTMSSKEESPQYLLLFQT